MTQATALFFILLQNIPHGLIKLKCGFLYLARKVIRRGNFSSKDDLKNKLKAFIAYFNETVARPFRWTYQGKPLAA